MPEQVNPDWEPRDSKFLQKFLDSDTGKKLVAKVKANEPEMAADTIEGSALQAAAFNQYRKDKELIKSLLQIPPESKEPTQYIDTSKLDVKG